MIVSVVVPVYNVESYLPRCLQSISSQTHRELEILLVDDGSTDSSGELCDAFAAGDPRARVIHKSNGGLSDARNAGIGIATGDFILCIDSDDFVTADHIELLLTSSLENDADIATSAFMRITDADPADMTAVGRREATEVLDTHTALRRLFYQRGITTSAWGKLYRRSLFDGITYPVGKLHEDLDTTYRIFAKASKVVVGTEMTYRYTERRGSITGAGFSERRLDALTFAEEAVKFIAGSTPALLDSATNRLFMEAVFVMSVMPIRDKQAGRHLKRVWEVIHQTRARVIRDRKSRGHVRLFALAAYFGKHSVRAVYRARAVASRAAWRRIAGVLK